MKILKFTSMECVHHSAMPGNDDVYFRITKDNGGVTLTIPNSPGNDHSWDVDEGHSVAFQPLSKLQDGTKIDGSNLMIPFNNNVVVELMDYDSMSGDDSLGRVTINASDGSGSKEISSREEEDKYILYYEILNV